MKECLEGRQLIHERRPRAVTIGPSVRPTHRVRVGESALEATEALRARRIRREDIDRVWGLKEGDRRDNGELFPRQAAVCPRVEAVQPPLQVSQQGGAALGGEGVEVAQVVPAVRQVRAAGLDDL